LQNQKGRITFAVPQQFGSSFGNVVFEKAQMAALSGVGYSDSRNTKADCGFGGTVRFLVRANKTKYLDGV
jgi:hypothetical protein